MMKSGKPFLIVVDEHGGTEGLVTAADLTGEIVGDEFDSSNDGESNFKQEEGQANKWILAGDLEIIELNRQLNLELPEAHDHHTIAGFLLEKLQHIPTVGESLGYTNLKFEITAMKGPRIEQVRLILHNIDVAKD